MAQSISFPIGSIGNVVLEESAGQLSATAQVAVASGLVKINLGVQGDSVALLKLLAADSSNPLLKSILAELAALDAVLPA